MTAVLPHLSVEKENKAVEKSPLFLIVENPPFFSTAAVEPPSLLFSAFSPFFHSFFSYECCF